MDLKTFFEHFDTLAEAPNGIQRLRELILDMAVRGKLVPQDPEDEPAEIHILSRQQNKKLPRQWICCELREALTLKSGMSLKKSEELLEGDIPYLKVSDMNIPGNEKFISTSSRYVRNSSNIKKGLIPPNSIIFPKRGGAIATNKKRINLNNNILVDSNIMALVCDKPNSIDLNYLFTWFSTIDLALLNTGTSVPQVNNKDIGPLLIPLPPLAEQKRIVAKVDELMGLCDALEAAQQNRNTLRQNLRASALDALMNASCDRTLETSWAFVRDNWRAICDRPEDVEGLRQVVLEAASRGRLVVQIKEEGQGSSALEASIRERKNLAQEELAQKSKPATPVIESEHPFPLPEHWAWVRIEDICTYIVDCLHRTPKYQEIGYPAIRTSEMRPGKILHETAKRVGEEEFQRQTQRLLPKAGDIFYSREGNYGIAAVVPPGIKMCLSQRMMQFRLTSQVYPDFFSWMMNSSVVFNQAVMDAAGMTVPHINIRALRKFVFPLPPLAEQKRIVAKVDELMQLCDRLEESLRSQQQHAEALTASAISHLAA